MRKENVEKATGVTALGARVACLACVAYVAYVVRIVCVVCVVSIEPCAGMKHAEGGVVHNGGCGDWQGKAPRGPKGS